MAYLGFIAVVPREQALTWITQCLPAIYQPVLQGFCTSHGEWDSYASEVIIPGAARQLQAYRIEHNQSDFLVLVCRYKSEEWAPSGKFPADVEIYTGARLLELTTSPIQQQVVHALAVLT